MNEPLDMRSVFAAMRSRLRLVVLVVVFTTLAGFLVTAVLPKVYESATSVLVGQTTESANLTREDILASQDLAGTYSDLARREPVLGPLTTELGLDVDWLELRDRVTVSLAPGNDQLIIVKARGGSQREATRLARGITEQLIKLAPGRTEDPNAAFLQTQIQLLQEEIQRRQEELAQVVTEQARAGSSNDAADLQGRADTLLRQVSDLQNNYSNLRDLVPREAGPNTLTVLESASVNPDPVRPIVVINLLISVILGVMIAAGLSYTLETRERRPSKSSRPSPPTAREEAWSAPLPSVLPHRVNESEPLTGAGSPAGGRAKGIETSSSSHDQEW